MAWEFEFLYGLQNIHTPVLDKIMIFFTILSDHGQFWLALALLFLCFKKTRETGIMMLLTLALGFLIGIPKDYSFPSGHTMVSFESAYWLWKFHRSTGLIAYAAAMITAFSRMYLFVHFPTDVLVGFLVSVLCVWAIERLAAKKGPAKERLTKESSERKQL